MSDPFAYHCLQAAAASWGVHGHTHKGVTQELPHTGRQSSLAGLSLHPCVMLS